jgi:hypothetical protein
MIVEYPKALYPRGWDDLDAMVTVHDAAQEAKARAEGYRTLLEPVAAAEVDDDTPDAPKRRGRPPKAASE